MYVEFYYFIWENTNKLWKCTWRTLNLVCTDRIRKLQQSYILLPEWILIGRDRWDRRPWFSVKHPHLPDCCWWYRSRTTSETTVPRTTRSRFTQRLHSILLHNSVYHGKLIGEYSPFRRKSKSKYRNT